MEMINFEKKKMILLEKENSARLAKESLYKSILMIKIIGKLETIVITQVNAGYSK